jgi:hypothetical protein
MDADISSENKGGNIIAAALTYSNVIQVEKQERTPHRILSV